MLSMFVFFAFFARAFSIRDDRDHSIEGAVKQCLISTSSPTFGHCMAKEALEKLQSWDNEPEFDFVDGVTLSRNPKEFREAFSFLDRDSSSFRAVINGLGHVFSSRKMKWDVGFISPGLFMQVTPSSGTPGYLEFAVDPHRDIFNRVSLKEQSTGRILARQFLVPVLTGMKFNVATLIPLMFGLIALIAKKAVIFSKLALIISSGYALATLYFGNNQNYNYQDYHQQQHRPQFQAGFGAHYGGNRFPEDYLDGNYRGNEDVTDELRISGNLQEVLQRHDKNGGRNFAWSEEDKQKKNKKK